MRTYRDINTDGFTLDDWSEIFALSKEFETGDIVIVLANEGNYVDALRPHVIIENDFVKANRDFVYKVEGPNGNLLRFSSTWLIKPKDFYQAEKKVKERVWRDENLENVEKKGSTLIPYLGTLGGL